MPLDKAAIDELKTALTLAKQRRINFGLCLGKKPETTVLIFDKIKAPEVLGRTAKKQGDTPRVTWGEIAVEGIKICFYCQGDILPGLQRKMKEFIQLTGLSYKPLIMDANGGVLEGEAEDGGGGEGSAPLQPGVSVDPLTQEWQGVKQRVGEAVVAVRELPGGDEILKAWQACVGIADGGDLRGAMTAAEKLGIRIAEARRAGEMVEADRQRWEAAAQRMAPMVREFEGSGSADARKVLAAWTFATTKASANPPDYAGAIKTIPAIVKLIQDARSALAGESGVAAQPVFAADGDGTAVVGDTGTGPGATGPQGGQGGGGQDAQPTPQPQAKAPTEPKPEAPGKDAPARKKFEFSDKAYAALAKAMTDYLVPAIPDVAETVPAAWTTARDKIDQQLAPMRPADAVVDEKKLAELQKAVEKIAAVVDQAVKDKGDFLKAHGLELLRLVPIGRHAEAGAVQISGKITKIKEALKSACEAAALQDFRKGLSILKPVAALCEAVERMEDELAHYNAILTDRETMVTAMAGTGDKQIDKVKAAGDKLLTDAKALAVKEKFADAVKKLDQIPALSDQYKRLGKFKADYDDRMPKAQTWLSDAKARPAEVQKLLKGHLDKLAATLKSAEVGKTGSYEASGKILLPLLMTTIQLPGWGAKRFLDLELDAATEYVDAKTAFDPQFETFKKHKGLSGIQEFFDQIDRERVQADSEAKSAKWGTAAALLRRSSGDWAAQKVLADKALTYLDKRKEVDKQVAETRKLKGAEELMGQVDAVLAAAFRQFADKDFDRAVLTLDDVKTRCTLAKEAANAQKDLEKKKDDKALKNGAKDIDKALKVYADVKAVVAGKDTGNVLAARLAEAEALAQAARDEKGKPAPDMNAAAGSVEAAVKLLETLLPKAVAAGPFATHLGEVKILQGQMTDPDSKLTPQINRVNTLITDAETLGKAPDFDFRSAEGKLVEAAGRARKAAADAALWPQIKADRADVETAASNITGCGTPAVVLMMKATTDRLAAWKKDIDDKITAEDFTGAARVAAVSKVAAAATANDLVTAQTANVNFKAWYTDRLNLLHGPDQARAQSQVDLLAKLKGQYDAAITAGNYDTANTLCAPMYWAISAGQRIIGEFALYELDRAAAETRLNLLRAARNDGVEEEVKKLEADYAAGTTLAGRESYLPAQKVMVAILPKINELITKAAEWKAYDDARKLADSKITPLESHDQAEAIRPMATALRGQLTSGIEAAKSGDLVGARAILDKIPAAADKAKDTADKAKAVIDKAGQIEGGAVDPALLTEAQTLFDDLNNRADADNARSELNVAKAQLAAAKKEPDPLKAAPLLKAAMQACTMAQTRLAQAEVIEEALKAVEALIGPLKAHAQKAYIADEVKALEEEIAKIRDDVEKKGPASADGRAKALNETCGKLKLLADAQAVYVTELAKPEAAARLKVLEEHVHRYAVKPSIDSFRKLLDEAAGKSAAKDPEAALKLLQKGMAIASAALLMAEMRANNPPSVDDVKKVLEGPGGSEELDAMIDELEPEAMRKVLRVAFEARFGCTLENFGDKDATGPINPIADGNLDGPNIKRFYQLMSKLPKDHVVNNDSMRKFEVIESGGGSYYQGDKKSVVMREGDDALSAAYGFGREHEVGGADKDCQPANQKEVKFFAWNTLHEVGHAVDDKLGFMDKNGAGAAYGGWTNHQSDTQTVGAAVAAHFKFDATYVGQLVAGNAAPPIPPKPPGEACSDEDWEMRRVEVTIWLKNALEPNSPWSGNETAKKIAIGGKVYQESYPRSWTSYNLEARKRGMTGYQFRAPGEWFAELYAAYHSDKLKPSHPATAWLKDL